jgi:hypothetical protein
VLLTACPTCLRELDEYLPEIKARSVYEWLDDAGAQASGAQDAQAPGAWPDAQASGAWAVFDACSARGEGGMKAAGRSLARSAGLTLSELPVQSGIARCCGYGGQPWAADRSFPAKVAADRAAESELPYITYCINCRDAFREQGKRARHILEVLFPAQDAGAAAEQAGAGAAGSSGQLAPGGEASASDGASSYGQSASGGEAPAPLPSATERRRNRERLRRALAAGAGAAAEHMAAGEEEVPVQYSFTLHIPEELLRKMSRERLLVDDAYAVVDFTRRTKRRVRDAQTGAYSGYRKIGHTTYWVTYSEATQEEGASIDLLNIYTHRMEIEMEQVWNGRRLRGELSEE